MVIYELSAGLEWSNFVESVELAFVEFVELDELYDKPMLVEVDDFETALFLCNFEYEHFELDS